MRTKKLLRPVLAACASLAVLVACVSLAMGGIAQGTDGQPLILGQINRSSGATHLKLAPGDTTGLVISQPGNGQPIIVQLGPGPLGCGICVSAAGAALALSVNGRAGFGGPVHFAQSGVVSIPAGTDQLIVPVPGLIKHSHALATPQKDTGASVASATARPARDEVVIHLTAAVDSSTPVAWFVFGG
jgi:hypothetical protein